MESGPSDGSGERADKLREAVVGAAMILFVVLVGWLGVDTSYARLVGVGWLLLAVGFELIPVRRRRSPT